MGFNDESLSDKILRLTDATSGALNQVVTGNYQTNAAKSEYQLKKSKYLHDLDNNVYSTSAQKALTGINNLFYGNSKTGVNGFFKDQLNDMNYEGYEQGTTSMLENTLTADYLMENYGMTATHAERFIDEYADTITAEAMQRTQTNTWMAMTSQLGTDQKSYTALMAESGGSVTEQYAKVSEHYNSNGGPSWDITGEFNPDKIENKLSFGYNWSISTGKTYVDTNLGKTGITFQQIVEGALGYFDNAMNEMGDGSVLSEATISASREEFEKAIKSYISSQANAMYSESQDKARNASNAFAQVMLSGNYVDSNGFEEIISDSGLSRDNVYDLQFILEFQTNFFGESNSSSKTSASSPEFDLLLNNYSTNFYNNYEVLPDECYTEINRMVTEEHLPLSIASNLYDELDKRQTFATINYGTVNSYVNEILGLDPNNKSLLVTFNNDPDIKKQIQRTLLSHPEWQGKDLYEFAQKISLELNSAELSKDIDKLIEIEFGKATGYEPEYNISNEDAYTVRAGIYSGQYTYLLRPEFSDRIMHSLINGTFSNEEDFEKSVSHMIFGKDISDLSNFEKSVVQANVLVNTLNAKQFKDVLTVLGECDEFQGSNEDYRMVDVYNFGAGAVADNMIYFIDNNGYLNVMEMEVGDDNWKSVNENNGKYGVMVDPSTLKSVGKINLKLNSDGNSSSLHSKNMDVSELSIEQKTTLSYLMTALREYRSGGRMIGGARYESK